MTNKPFDHQSQSHLNHEQSLIHTESEHHPGHKSIFLFIQKRQRKRTLNGKKWDERTEECNGTRRRETNEGAWRNGTNGGTVWTRGGGDKQRNGIMKGGMGRTRNGMNEKRNRMNAQTKWDVGMERTRNGMNKRRNGKNWRTGWMDRGMVCTHLRWEEALSAFHPPPGWSPCASPGIQFSF